jgi:hypothetical protein
MDWKDYSDEVEKGRDGWGGCMLATLFLLALLFVVIFCIVKFYDGLVYGQPQQNVALQINQKFGFHIDEQQDNVRLYEIKREGNLVWYRVTFGRTGASRELYIIAEVRTPLFLNPRITVKELLKE